MRAQDKCLPPGAVALRAIDGYAVQRTPGAG
jgi:hypothetical protein